MMQKMWGSTVVTETSSQIAYFHMYLEQRQVVNIDDMWQYYSVSRKRKHTVKARQLGDFIEHEDAVERHASGAERLALQASSAARTGRCDSAIALYGTARQRFGSALAHRSEVPGQKLRPSVAEAFKRADLVVSNAERLTTKHCKARP